MLILRILIGLFCVYLYAYLAYTYMFIFVYLYFYFAYTYTFVGTAKLRKELRRKRF